ncbi:MAG: trypsin-like peptidase domain-containing protein [Myxococcales bacterium]|nr:trypsin-like peptidase domain-containing protein [Myxococcales bacterium]
MPVVLDPERDVAVLAIAGDHENLVPLAHASHGTVRVRQTVTAIGYPLDPGRVDPQSSRGIVSGALSDGSLQLDIAVNPGNSGGPLIDDDENVIGMVVARGRMDRAIQHLGIAVPLATLRSVAGRADEASVAAARRRLETNPEQWAELATIVDGTVRVGTEGVVHGIISADDDARMQALLTELQRISTSVTNPNSQLLIAAVFWNASQALLERAGGNTASGTFLPSNTPKRRTIMTVERRAEQLCLDATTADHELMRRSPFARWLFAVALHAGVAPTPLNPSSR